jgi:hypothetical protein
MDNNKVADCFRCMHCKQWSPFTDSYKPVKLRQKKVMPIRVMKWRRINTDENENMRSAVWLYRAVPIISSEWLQRKFGIAVKTLMRYVRNSYDVNFKKFNLYFGGVDTFGNRDRSRSLVMSTRRADSNINLDFTNDELNDVRKCQDIPLGAAKFLDKFIKMYYAR